MQHYDHFEISAFKDAGNLKLAFHLRTL